LLQKYIFAGPECPKINGLLQIQSSGVHEVFLNVGQWGHPSEAEALWCGINYDVSPIKIVQDISTKGLGRSSSAPI